MFVQDKSQSNKRFILDWEYNNERIAVTIIFLIKGRQRNITRNSFVMKDLYKSGNYKVYCSTKL